MASVYIPSVFRRLTNGKSEVTVSASSIAELLAELDALFPGIGTQLYDDHHKIREYIAVFVNETDMRELDGEQTSVTSRDRIHIVSAIAGG
jgi:adenylyltransferase/sulfurtransferase